MNKLVTLLFFFIVTTAFCQERQQLQGHINAGDAVANEVFVINKATGAETKTDSRGNFTLPVKMGDILVVYSNKTDIREFTINQFTFKEVPFEMAVNAKAYDLDEVVINQQVTSESLGIVPKNQLRRTVAERRLYTAGGTEFTLGFGFSLSLDAVINSITGRLKMLRKALATERKEFAIEAINGLYTDYELINDLKIPEDYIRGFAFYAVEDAECAAALKDHKDELAKLRLLHLAQIYLQLLKEGGIQADAPAVQTNPTVNEN